ncbi:MAG: hypothetical protein M3Z26_17635 [Bacteroidota bacterium]|nr:hypothetical protein [Bacteroidota bacterium]
MNIQNISALAEKLQSLGFDNLGYSILKRICFKPDSFMLSEKMLKVKDQVSFNLYFERDGENETYTLMYYDAILQKEMAIPSTEINGIDIPFLEKRMAEIDWKIVFALETKKQLNAEDKASWEKEQKIESLIEELKTIETSEEGKSISTGLKLKFWAGIPYQELVGSITPLKNKSEVIQRFYLFDGKLGISADEAFRFLQNRWLEKQMQAKHKQSDDSKGEDNNSRDQPSSSYGTLLKKKRLTKAKISKSNKAIQK